MATTRQADSSPGDDWPALRRNRDFIALLIGQGGSALGDAVSFTAVPLLVYLLTGSGLAIGIIGLLQTLPDLVVGLLVGALADRWDRRRVMLVADLGRAFLTALIPISFALGWPTMIVLLLVTGPINVLRVFFLAAYTASIPMLVGRQRIGAATAAFEGVLAIGFIFGPAIAGLLSATIGPAATLGIDAVSFFLSAAALGLVRRKLSSERTSSGNRHLGTEILEGVRFVARHPVLRLAVGLWSVYVILVAAWPAVMLFYMKEEHGLGADAFGLVVGGYGLGLLLGASIAGRSVRSSLGPPMLVGTGAVGVLVILMATQASVPVLIVLATLAGIAEIPAVVGYGTLRATVTPDRLLGRVSTTARTISVGGQSLGFLVAGLLLDRIGGGATLAAMGVAVLTTALLFSLAPSLRRARVEPVDPANG
jgi:MFS family permease